MKRKKFKDTKVGQFLLGKSGVVNSIANVLPDKGLLGMVKNLIKSDKELTPVDKETALKLLEQDMIEMQEVTKRWAADMMSDSWLSKNTRPLSLIFLTVMTIALIWVDSHNYVDFTVSEEWIGLLKTLTITVYVAYFGSRGAEKVGSIVRK
jgi:hypothetical protein|tara:strand:- start:915 stop:1367 length:453 start_codon:yes stop_codon:yes gene_type:complete